MAGPRFDADYTATGPDTLAGKFLRSFWQPVYQSARLAAGKAMPLQLLGEEFTLFRGKNGAAHVIAPYCAHRGLRLSVGRVEGDGLSCFYHGWTYDGKGQCIAQPAEKRSFADKVRIASYPTQEYLGLIFCYFGEGAPPELPRLSVYEDNTFHEIRESRRDWSCFSQLENSVDEVHFAFTHRKSKFTDVGLNDELPDLEAEETDYGILRIGKRGNEVRRSHILMPNCMYSMVFEHFKGWAEHIAWRVPIDDRSHVSFMIDCVHKSGADAEEYTRLRQQHRDELKKLEPTSQVVDRIMRGEIHADDLPWRPDIVLIQDGVALQGQPLWRNRRDDLLGASDRQVIMLRQIWAREMQAIAEGKPTKRWQVPRDLVPTSGTGQETRP
jgi:5,5'-dehydrodivanillate O-demethylase oxygenase subunit